MSFLRRLFSSNVFDDWVDRLNHFWTFYLLLLLSAIAGWQKYQQDRISCWCPTQFTGSMVQYTHRMCWDSKQYYLPMDEHIPDGHMNAGVAVAFYQWIPLLLALQALVFKLPHVVWLLDHGFSGLNMSKIQNLGKGTPSSTWQDHKLTSVMVARYLDGWLKSNFLSCLPWRALTVLTGIVKLLYIINAFTQFNVIDSFLLPGNTTNFGYQYASRLLNNKTTEWLKTPWFPHMILCDFQIRQLQTVQRWTVQCLLPINEFHEQVYCFVSIWILVVGIITTFSFVMWLVKVILPFFRTRYVERLLRMSQDIDGQRLNQIEINAFTWNLGEDGIMVLKSIGENSSELMVSDVVVNLWKLRQAGQSGPGAVVHLPPIPGPPAHGEYPPPNPYFSPQPPSTGNLYPQASPGQTYQENVPLVAVSDPSRTKVE